MKCVNYTCCAECRSLEEAFKDLHGLMAKAAEMVDLAERFRSTMAAQRKAGQQGSEGAEQADVEAQQWMDTEMQAELVNMGIASPVTKAESGARYHQELSRQVLVQRKVPGSIQLIQSVQLFPATWHVCMHVCMYVCLLSWGPTEGQQTKFCLCQLIQSNGNGDGMIHRPPVM